jgi:hypothetical protein
MTREQTEAKTKLAEAKKKLAANIRKNSNVLKLTTRRW